MNMFSKQFGLVYSEELDDKLLTMSKLPVEDQKDTLLQLSGLETERVRINLQMLSKALPEEEAKKVENMVRDWLTEKKELTPEELKERMEIQVVDVVLEQDGNVGIGLRGRELMVNVNANDVKAQEFV